MTIRSDKWKGCGPGAFMLLVPQFIFRADCSIHDQKYREGGGLIDKTYADMIFFALMLKDIQKGGYGFLRRYGYFLAATVYFFFVSTFGLLLFKWRI